MGIHLDNKNAKLRVTISNNDTLKNSADYKSGFEKASKAIEEFFKEESEKNAMLLAKKLDLYKMMSADS